jgi:hypothetical protein
VAALILEVASRPGRTPSYRRLEDGELRLGRGLDNDVIVGDPFIGAQQLRLVPEERGVLAYVLDRTNNAFVNGRYLEDAQVRLEVGDELLVGHTRLRLLGEGMPVPAARQMIGSRWSRLGHWRAVLAGLMWCLLCAYALFFDYQKSFDAVNWPQLLTSVLLLGLIVLAWAALWAVIGRLWRNQAQLASQLFVSATMTWLMIQVTVTSGYVDYASNSPRLASLFDWSMSLLVSVLLLYYNLSLATTLKRPLVWAATPIALLFAAVIGLEAAQRGVEGVQWMPAPSVKPPFARLQTPRDLDQQLESLELLFAEARLAAD